MSWMVTHLDAVFTPERKSAEKFDCDVIHPWRLRFCFFKVVLHVADDHIFWVASSLMDNCTLLMRLNLFLTGSWMLNDSALQQRSSTLAQSLPKSNSLFAVQTCRTKPTLVPILGLAPPLVVRRTCSCHFTRTSSRAHSCWGSVP